MLLPWLAPHLVAKFIPNEGLFLLSEHGSDVLEGAVFGEIFMLLDGKHTIDEILDHAQQKFSSAEVLYAIELLNKHGYIIDGSVYTNSEWPEFIASRGITQEAAKISITNYSSKDAKVVYELLRDQGIALAEASESLMPDVVLVDDYDCEELEKYNIEALRLGRTWMLAKLSGSILWLGPVFVPGDTGCWQCLRYRLRLNRRVHRFLFRRTGEVVQLPPISAPVLEKLAASLLVNEIIHWQTGSSSLIGNLRTFDTVYQKHDDHNLVRRPHCSACGSIENWKPVQGSMWHDEHQIVNRDGGIRGEEPEVVLARLSKHISPILGIVTHLRSIPTGNQRIHVYGAGHNYGATGGTLKVLTKTIRNASSGKGLSEAQAQASALCEAIERYSTIFQGYEDFEVGSFDNLRGKALNPTGLMQFSAQQYLSRKQLNVNADAFDWIPERFEESEAIWWSPVKDIYGGEERLLPTAYLYFHSEHLKDFRGMAMCLPDSNGVAAGSTYSDATLQAILELVERDAIALWWYPRVRLPGVDLLSFSSSFLTDSIEHHRSMGRELWVLDATSDLGIPSFVGISRRLAAQEQIVLGFGAHIDATIAVQRAVAETNQLLAGIDAHLNAGEKYSTSTTEWLESATVAKHSYLLPANDRQSTVTSFTYPNVSTIAASLEHCVDLLLAKGLRTYLLDLTRPDIDLKVVRAICPGLRHFWRRLAPGRLYEVPKSMHRIEKVQSEADMNPISMFL